jgi:hypothetical protein
MSKLHYLANQMNPLPSYPDLKVDDVDRELYKHGYDPKPIPNYWWKEGDSTVPISPDQQDEWSRYTGNEFKIGGMGLHDRWSWLIKQPWYKNMTPTMQKQELHSVYSGYFEAGKVHLGQKYPQLLQQEIQGRMKENLGVLPAPEGAGENLTGPGVGVPEITYHGLEHVPSSNPTAPPSVPTPTATPKFGAP